MTALRKATDDLLRECRESQVVALYVRHAKAPWKGYANIPSIAELVITYSEVRTMLLNNSEN